MKRSAQVVLVVMAATNVGATSYALMPREDCAQTQMGQAQPESCRRSSSSGSSRGSSGSSSSHSSSTNSSSSSSTGLMSGTERAGFGGFGQAFASHSGGS